MGNRKQLKGVNKNRHSSKAGTRRRGRCKKSVFEKRRLRMFAMEVDNV